MPKKRMIIGLVALLGLCVAVATVSNNRYQARERLTNSVVLLVTDLDQALRQDDSGHAVNAEWMVRRIALLETDYRTIIDVPFQNGIKGGRSFDGLNRLVKLAFSEDAAAQKRSTARTCLQARIDNCRSMLVETPSAQDNVAARYGSWLVPALDPQNAVIDRLFDALLGDCVE